jgi:O-antigen ligase
MTLSLIYLLLFLIPIVGLLSGFSVAITTPLLLIVILIALGNTQKVYFKYIDIKNNLLANWKLELLFSLWCFISNFYSLSYPAYLFIYWQICLISLLGFIVNSYTDKLSINIRKAQIFFLIGVTSAIILFFTEYLSHGLIIRTFRAIFQAKSSGEFFLFLLDRGCCLLSLLSWVVIAIFLYYQKYLLALIYYMLIFYLLYISDSLASFLAFTVAGLVFLTCRLLTTKFFQTIFFKFLTIAVISGSILMPIISYQIQPLSDLDTYAKFLPDSAKHRVFIWHFVAKKILEKPILGRGFASSKNVKITESDMVHYNNATWHPFPLHPHNNIMQIIFETGLIGFLLFLSLIYKYLQKISHLTLIDPILTHYRTKEFINTKKIATNLLNLRSIAYACFINYYIIGMIAFSIWQIWWVCCLFTTIILLKLLTREW